MPTIEERLAALETKLAALTATTPTEYYTHQYSGEEIDAAVGRALTGGALDTSVTNVSNQLGTFVRPNLLDNWYFGRPVNQRGVEEFAVYSYGLDRWWANSSITGAITYRDNRLVIANQVGLIQKMDDYTPLNGKIVTISLLTTDNELFWSTGLFVDKDHDLTFDSGDIIQFYYSTYFSGWQFYVKQSRNILAVKLELGSTQTLAHREGDKWVINEVPDYGEQLRRCQRYYQKFDENVTLFYGNSGSSGGAGARLFLPTAVQMRTKPVTSPFVINVLPEGTIAGTNNITFTPSDVAVVPGGVCLYGAVSPSVSIGSYTYKAIVAQLRNAPLALSADL